ncbi:MAG: TonB family protein [Acidobacteriales bacterium]|nr:TonB family protein [Terriglobales bacterium]
MASAASPKPAEQSPRLSQPDILPTLFGSGYGTYGVQPKTYVLSFLMHIAALAIMVAASLLIARNQPEVKKYIGTVIDLSDYILPAAPDNAGGGGGGGAREKLTASQGAPPKAADEQFTPPTVVVRQEPPKLAAEPTVIVPPQIKLADASLGEALSKIQIPSNGIGAGAGIGEGSSTGVGAGRGPGVGQGYGGGIGGGAYRVGGGVSAPRTLYAPDPEYSEEARKAKYQGVVVLWVVVGPDGRVHDMRVSRPLGLGLDEKALEAVKQWRFEPARKDGQAVAVQVNIEVNFRLY